MGQADATQYRYREPQNRSPVRTTPSSPREASWPPSPPGDCTAVCAPPGTPHHLRLQPLRAPARDADLPRLRRRGRRLRLGQLLHRARLFGRRRSGKSLRPAGRRPSLARVRMAIWRPSSSRPRSASPINLTQPHGDRSRAARGQTIYTPEPARQATIVSTQLTVPITLIRWGRHRVRRLDVYRHLPRSRELQYRRGRYRRSSQPHHQRAHPGPSRPVPP